MRGTRPCKICWARSLSRVEHPLSTDVRLRVTAALLFNEPVDAFDIPPSDNQPVHFASHRLGREFDIHGPLLLRKKSEVVVLADRRKHSCTVSDALGL